jgi:hypothetical protein
MINYDIPGNPNRLEQPKGRIHRFGKKSTAWVQTSYPRAPEQAGNQHAVLNVSPCFDFLTLRQYHLT